MRSACCLYIFVVFILTFGPVGQFSPNEKCAIAGHSNLKIFNFLQSVLTTWWVNEVVRQQQYMRQFVARTGRKLCTAVSVGSGDGDRDGPRNVGSVIFNQMTKLIVREDIVKSCKDIQHLLSTLFIVK
jgi:hypothetical protein